MTLQRSCWKIPKAAMTVVDRDGNDTPAFVDLVVYDESPHFVYALAAQWDRPDIDAVPSAKREDLSKAISRARFVRTSVRRRGAQIGDPDVMVRVKASAVQESDVIVDSDVPVVLFAGDSADDMIGAEALAEASARMIAEGP